MSLKHHGPGGCCCGACAPIKIPDWTLKNLNPSCLNWWHKVIAEGYENPLGGDATLESYPFRFYESVNAGGYPDGVDWQLKDWPECAEIEGFSGKWIRAGGPGILSNCGGGSASDKSLYAPDVNPPVDGQQNSEESGGYELSYTIDNDSADFTMVLGAWYQGGFSPNAFHFVLTPGEVSVLPVANVHEGTKIISEGASCNWNRHPTWAKDNVAMLAKDYITKALPNNGSGFDFKVTLEGYHVPWVVSPAGFGAWSLPFAIASIFINDTEVIRTAVGFRGLDYRANERQVYGRLHYGFQKLPVGNDYNQLLDESAANNPQLVAYPLRPFEGYNIKDTSPLKISGTTIRARRQPASDIVGGNGSCAPHSDSWQEDRVYSLSENCVSKRFRDGIPYACQPAEATYGVLPATISLSGFTGLNDGDYPATDFTYNTTDGKRMRKTQQTVRLTASDGHLGSTSWVDAGTTWTVYFSTASIAGPWLRINGGAAELELRRIAVTRNPLVVGENNTWWYNIIVRRGLFDPDEHDGKSISINEGNAGFASCIGTGYPAFEAGVPADMATRVFEAIFTSGWEATMTW